MKVLLKKAALKDLQSFDKQWQKKSISLFKDMENWDDIILRQQLTQLVGLKKVLYRIRIGQYRAILNIENDTIFVLRVLNRKNAYKKHDLNHLQNN